MAPPFALAWPWIGLGAAALLGVLLATDVLRGDRLVPRWRDPSWLAWVAVWAYLVHQFEEHGVDLLGEHYAFRPALCATLGAGDAGRCGIPADFITAVNVPLTWVVGPACAWLGRRWPAVALSFFATPAVNGFAHLAPAVAGGAYNPGVGTGALLFLPLSAWALLVAGRRADLGWRAVAATGVAGVAVHAVLMGSLVAYLGGWIGLAALLGVQVVNPVWPPLFVAWATRRGAGAGERPRSPRLRPG